MKRIKASVSSPLSGKRGLLCLLWILLVFGVSFWISRFSFNRPMGGEWVTSHALVSMRAFEEWGFVKLGGISTLIPKTPELSWATIPRLPRHDPYVYLSYPPFWLWGPYFTFRVLNFSFNVELSVAFLELYNLIVNRLGSAVALFFLGRWLGRRSNLSENASLVSGLLLSSVWMLQTPAMFWTQNTYFSDVAVLLPSYLFSFWVLTQLDRKSAPSGREATAGSALAAWCIGTDWFGWIVVAMGITLLILSRRLRASFWPVVGGLGSSVIYGVQLFWFGNRLEVLWERFVRRTGVELHNGDPTTFQDTLNTIVSHWRGFTLPFSGLLPNLNSATIALTCVALASIPFFFGRLHKPIDRKLALAGWLMLVLCPLIQIAVLSEHSAIHSFAAMKVGLLVSLGWLALAWGASWLTARWARGTPAECALVGVALIILAINLNSAKLRYPQFAGPVNPTYQKLAEEVSTHVKPDQLLVSKDLSEAWDPPEKLWYLNRMVYLPERLERFETFGLIRSDMEKVTLTLVPNNGTTAVPEGCIWLNQTVQVPWKPGVEHRVRLCQPGHRGV